MKENLVVVVPEKTFPILQIHKYVLHVDFDHPIPPSWIEIWKLYKTTMLETMGFQVERTIFKDPKDVHPTLAKTLYKGRKGTHVWIHIASPHELDEDTINMLQWLCCDDPTRVWINRMRIVRGLRKYWNKLFSRHVWVREMDEKCKKCKIRRILYEMGKEMEKI